MAALAQADLFAAPAPDLWTPPAPGMGSKSRDAEEVAGLLEVWRPAAVRLPFAGLGGELSRWGGAAPVFVADQDTAVRAIWETAHRGQLAAAGAEARRLWDEVFVGLAPGHAVRFAWDALRRAELEFRHGGTTRYATWALMVFAGSIRGIRRRNSRGGWNASYSPVYEPGFLPGRIAAPAELAAADRWAIAHVGGVFPDWTALYSGVVDGAAFLIDPPYGVERKAVYGRSWTDEQRAALAAQTLDAIGRGARAVVWCGPEDIATWRAVDPEGRLRWRFRAARTCMKSARVRKDGEREPARHGAGGWLGVTR